MAGLSGPGVEQAAGEAASNFGHSARDAEALFGVSKSYIAQARALVERDPEAAAAVKAGAVALADGYEALREREQEARRSLTASSERRTLRPCESVARILWRCYVARGLRAGATLAVLGGLRAEGGSMPTTAQQVAAEVRTAFVEILEEQAESARHAARLAHACRVEAERDEAGERSSAYFSGQRDALDAIAEQFDRVAFNLTQGGSHAE